MTRDPLHDLARLTAAQTSVHETRMQKLVVEENAIRSQIADLTDQHRQACALPANQMVGLRQAGADILWQGWISRNQRALQLRLARVLAQKGAVLRDLRQAHGRKSAAEEMCRTALKAARDGREKTRIAQDQSLMTLQAARTRRG